MEAAAAIHEPVANLYHRYKDPTVKLTRPKFFRVSKPSPELIKAVTEVRAEKKLGVKRKFIEDRQKKTALMSVFSRSDVD